MASSWMENPNNRDHWIDPNDHGYKRIAIHNFHGILSAKAGFSRETAQKRQNRRLDRRIH